MPTCYPPLSINLTSIDFNEGGTGFTSSYIVPDPSCEPAECALPPLIDVDLSLPDQTLTSPQGGCKYTFNSVFPMPPIYIPKPVIPNIPCPQGVSFETAITFVGSGGAEVTGGISVTGGPCNYLLGGIVDINIPNIACPGGSSFSSSVTNTAGPSSLSVLGGPCNFAMIGNIAPGGGGNDVAATCLTCADTCCSVRTNIENKYTALGTTPAQGDIISVCVAVYEVVGNPNPTSTCTSGCPSLITAQVVDFTVSGTTYFARQLSTSCTATAYTPFFIFADSLGSSSYNVHLYPGTVSQLLPTNMFSVITATITSPQYVVLTVNSTGYNVSSSSWSLMSSAPVPPTATVDTPPTIFYSILGIINVVGGAAVPLQVVNNNLTATPVVWATVSRPGAGPFELASENYYNWQVD